MAKKPSMRWRDKDNREMQRIVNNYNAKLRRLEKKNPEIAEYLPEKMTMKKLRSKIETRQDFNRELNSLARFSRRGAEKLVEGPKGLKVTQYEVDEAKTKVRIVNIKRAYERKKLGFSPEKGNMGQIESQNLQPKKFSLNKTPREWEKFMETLDKEVATNFKANQLEKYKENYLKGINENLGEKGEELAKLLDTLEPEALFTHSVTNPLLTIDFIYDPLETETIINAKIEAWKEVM